MDNKTPPSYVVPDKMGSWGSFSRKVFQELLIRPSYKYEIIGWRTLCLTPLVDQDPLDGYLRSHWGRRWSSKDSP